MSTLFTPAANRDRKKHLSMFLKILVLLLPVVWGFFVVHQYGVNVFFWDEWEWIRNKDEFLTFDNLWHQHNEHRMLFPNLIVWAFGVLFSWNSKVFMFVSQGILFLLYYIAIRNIGKDKKLIDFGWKEVVFSSLVGICIYNGAQHENLLWGFQIAWFLIICCGAVSYYYFNKYILTNKNSYFVWALVLAIVSSYSSLHGLTVWSGYIVYIVYSLLTKEGKNKRNCLIIGIVCIFTVGLYFWNWHTHGGHSVFAAKDPFQLIKYFIGMSGSVFADNKLRYVMGFLALSTTCIIILRDLFQKRFELRIRLWGPILMGIAAMFVTSVGRAGMGMIQSRYATNDTLFIVFLLLLLYEVLNVTSQIIRGKETGHDEKYRIIKYRINYKTIYLGLTVFAWSMLIMLCLRNYTIIPALQNSYETRMNAKEVLVNYKYLNVDDYTAFYPLRPILRTISPTCAYLEQNRLNAFADDNDGIMLSSGEWLGVSEYKTITDPGIKIDTVNGNSFSEYSFVYNNKKIEINGTITKEKIKGKNVYLNIRDVRFPVLLNEEENNNVRFSAKFVAEKLEPGIYEFYILAVDRRNERAEKYFCGNITVLNMIDNGIYTITDYTERNRFIGNNGSTSGAYKDNHGKAEPEYCFQVEKKDNGYYSVINISTGRTLEETITNSVGNEESGKRGIFGNTEQDWMIGYIHDEYYIVTRNGRILTIGEETRDVQVERYTINQKNQVIYMEKQQS